MKTFLLLPLLLLALIAGRSEADELRQPNVVLIISDDHAWTDYGFMGHKEIHTPNIDRLAREGRTFTRGYVTTALCSPSLATLLTGLHPHQHGITGNDPDGQQQRKAWLDRFFQNPMLPRQLADRGYLTLQTGKYWMRNPESAGFTDSMGHTDRHGGKALSIGRNTMQPIDDFIDKAKAAEKPFFVWYAPLLPHTPHNPPQRLLKRYAKIQPAARAKYFAMVEWLDETCGALMAQLKDKGVDDNTLIIYLADNGWNEFGKASPYENGVRTPIILHWPGRIAAKTDDQHLAQTIDIMPTILAACEIARPNHLPGLNLLDETAVAERDRIFLAQYAHNMVSPTDPARSLWSRSCIYGPWKLISWVKNPPTAKPNQNGEQHKNLDANLELFDLVKDPFENTNLATAHPEIVDQLLKSLDERLLPETTQPK
jgi:arylsulfatase A-like enzyme